MLREDSGISYSALSNHDPVKFPLIKHFFGYLIRGDTSVGDNLAGERLFDLLDKSKVSISCIELFKSSPVNTNQIAAWCDTF